MIQVICPSDGTLHYAEESDIGETLRCRKCGVILKIESQDQRAEIGTELQPVEKQAEASVTSEPPAAPRTNGARPRSRIRREHILIATVLGATGLMLVIAFWPNTPSPISTQEQPTNPVVRDTSPQPSSGVPAPVKPAPQVKQVQSKPVLGENPVGVLPPCAQGREPLRPRTGERIEPDDGISGESNIQVTNVGSLDAAVRLVDNVTGRTLRFVYVQAGHSFAIARIEAGTYSVRVQFGRDWISECHQFMRDTAYSEYAQPLVFLDDRIRFYTVTLNPVPAGNAVTRKIDRKRFFEGD